MADLKLTRTFAADPAHVFEVLTRAENIAKWWGPEGMTVPDLNMDFSKVGDWHSVMENAEGGRYKVSGRVLSIDPPNSVEFTWGWHDDNDARGHESHVRFDVRQGESGGAVFTVTHSDLPDGESRDNHDIGWTSTLRKLEALIP